MSRKRFTLTKQHIVLLRNANVGWNEGECGAAGLDTKRPYGNSDYIQDIAGLLGNKSIRRERDITSDEEMEFERLHRETQTALQVVLATGSFQPGTYEADEYRSNWRAVGIA